jgi:hypothetical protein
MQLESAVSFAVPLGCAASQAVAHACVVHVSVQAMSAVQSVSPRHVFASAQQLASRHASHAAIPLPKPHALVEGGDEAPPPQALEQLVPTHVERVSSSAAPVGWADMHAERHASSVHASPHVRSAVQSASETHAVLAAQQLASRQVSQVGSPVESPHVPAPASAPPAPPPDRTPSVGVRPCLVLADSAAIAEALPPGRETASFDRQPLAGDAAFEGAGSLLPGSVVRVSVIVQANSSVDVMAITPKVMTLICPPRPVLGTGLLT